MSRKRMQSIFGPGVILLLLVSLRSDLSADFVRGDTNRDGIVDISDAIAHLQRLFLGGKALSCDDAADSNDDGQLDLSDPTSTLDHLFKNRQGLPTPGTTVEGPDPTCDDLGCQDSTNVPAIVLSEIHYNPLASEQEEFVEVYNRTPVSIDVSGLRLGGGIDFTFPEGTVMAGGEFLLVVKIPRHSIWQAHNVMGPYGNWLANGGEVVTLVGDCIAETLPYEDQAPWATGADGYGPTLERIDGSAPADDHHSWRASVNQEGTPGEANSTAGTPTHPLIVHSTVDPEHPTSDDPVAVTIRLDVPPGDVVGVTLHWERLTERFDDPGSVTMGSAASDEISVDFTATLPAMPSQSMVRYTIEVELAGVPSPVVLPHIGERVPFLSHFVYDDEIPSLLPIMWNFFPRSDSGILADGPRGLRISGSAVKEVDSSIPAVFDGAEIRVGRQGFKVKFVKGAEYRGDRKLIVLPERGSETSFGGVGGPFAPTFEHFGYQTYRDVGAVAPRPRFMRLLNPASPSQSHTQRVVFQQVNENFLELNGIDPDGDLYKNDQDNYEKRTNKEFSSATLTDLLEELRSDNAEQVRRAVLQRLDRENMARYSVGSVLINHGDNWRNNMWLYHDLTADGRWIVMPHDLDVILSGTGSVGAPHGDIHSAYHAQPELDQYYRELLLQAILPGGPFSLEVMEPKIQAQKDLLLADLLLQEAFMGVERTERRELIIGGFAHIRQHVTTTVASLLNQLK